MQAPVFFRVCKLQSSVITQKCRVISSSYSAQANITILNELSFSHAHTIALLYFYKSLVQGVRKCPPPLSRADHNLVFSERNKDRVHTLKIVNIAVLNDRRENKFPVNFKKPVIFKIDVINNGTAVTPTTAYIDIEGYAQALYFNCDWYPFPTFGLLQGVLPSMPGEAWKCQLVKEAPKVEAINCHVGEWASV
ncbi:hypothetical protein D918_04419 [Trichuris suis]|nr:hypothetical protein D918_04419 [Trichuris suis]